LWVSNGTDPFSLTVQCTTSAGTWTASAGQIVDFYRLLNY
jgi:hypothetical protein